MQNLMLSILFAYQKTRKWVPDSDGIFFKKIKSRQNRELAKNKTEKNRKKNENFLEKKPRSKLFWYKNPLFKRFWKKKPRTTRLNREKPRFKKKPRFLEKKYVDLLKKTRNPNTGPW